MSIEIRFGKKNDTPAVASIEHEQRVMAAIHDLSDGVVFEASTARPDLARDGVASELARKHGISIDRAGMLVDRFAENHGSLDVASVPNRVIALTLGGAL